MSCGEETMDCEHPEIEANVVFYRDIIVGCIQDPFVVSALAGTVIDGGDEKELRELYLKRPSCEATDKFLDLVLQSKEPGKWKAFIDALNKADYPYIANLLQTKTRPDQNQKNERQMIRIFFPHLEKRIEVHEMTIELFSKSVINDMDKQQIVAVLEQKGNVCASVVLLEKMQCRQSPAEWYQTFLKALITTGHKDIVHDMEPTFQDDPDQFKSIGTYRPKAGCSSSGQKRARSNSIAMDVNDDFYDVREHNMSVYEEADTLKQNMANPFSHISSDDEQMTKRIKKELVEFTNCEEENNDTIYYSYQEELGKKSFNKNVIICEPTGTGKTMIAFYIIDKHLKTKQGKGRVAFMATNSSLVTQQAEKCVQVLSKYQVKRISAEDHQQAEMIGAFLPYSEILFFTPQILINNLESGGVNIQKFSMLVFDECHHTKGESPYNDIMRKYLEEKHLKGQPYELPQIVGLTATPGIGNSRSAGEACEEIVKLCARMDVVTLPQIENKENIAEIEQKTTRPTEEIIPIEKRLNDPCSSILLKAIVVIEGELIRQALILYEMIDIATKKIPADKMSSAYIQWSNEVVNTAHRVTDNDEITRDIISCAEFLNTFSSALEVNNLLPVKDVIRWLTLKRANELNQQNKLSDTEKLLVKTLQDSQIQLIEFREEDNPNVRALSNTLRFSLLEKGNTSRAMVFVHSRETCKSLTAFLGNELGEEDFRVHHFYGKGNRRNIEGMTEKEQSDTVANFRDGYYKVLVTTSIGTEGIDIPDCNIVLTYNYTQNEIRKVQMQGRSRKKDGTIYTMGDARTILQEQLNVYKVILMQEGMTKARELDTDRLKNRVTFIQQDELRIMKAKQSKLEANERRQKSNKDFELRCIRCNALVCNIAHVRKITIRKNSNHHIVDDPAFKERIDQKPVKSKYTNYDGFQKKFIFGCKACPNDWGTATEYHGVLCFKLKCVNEFKCVNMEAKRRPMIAKWEDVPYLIKETPVLDLLKI